MKNKIALITGATAGIGLAIAERFAASGCDLIITGRREDRLKDISSRLGSSVCVLPLVMDVRDNTQVVERLNSLPPDFKKIDILINNAGLASGLSTIDEGDLSDWEVMIDTNIKGLLYVSRIVIPWMRDRKAGHIVNIGSIAGKEAYLKGNVYCATKHAVDALSKSMRIDLLPHHIRVTGIHPGAVETEFSMVRYKGDTEKASQVYKGFEPLRAEDIADAVHYCVNTPAHVNINEMIIMPSAQANTTHLLKENI